VIEHPTELINIKPLEENIYIERLALLDSIRWFFFFFSSLLQPVTFHLFQDQYSRPMKFVDYLSGQ